MPSLSERRVFVVAFSVAASLSLNATTSAALVGHWKLDEGTGTTVADSGAGNNPGTTNGGPTWITDQLNLPAVPSGTSAALSFDGGDDNVTITAYKGITGTNPRTIAAWVRTANTNAAQDMSIISWGTNSAGQKWNFRVQASNGTQGAIRVEVNGGYLVGNTVITDGEWHHVALSWEDDGSPNVTDAKLYVDGALDAELGSGTNEPSATTGRAINTAVGNDVRIGIDFSSRRWNGDIDDVRIYDEVLDLAAIQLLAIGTPVINDFTADAEVVATGGALNLSWEVEPFDTLTLDNGVDPPVDVSGDTDAMTGTGGITRNPTSTTTYTLTGVSGSTTTARQLTVLVNEAPRILSFTPAGTGVIQAGGMETLRWETFGEATLDLSPAPGDVTGTTEAEVSPGATTTYTLSATNAFGTSTADFEVEVLTGIVPDLSFTTDGMTDGAIAGWDPTVNLTTDANFRFGGPGGTVQSGATNFTGIERWVNSPRFNLSPGNGDSWQDSLGNAATQTNVSWEMVFRPGNYTGRHVLFNTGGNGDGTAIVLEGNTLDFRFQDADSDTQRLIAATDLSAIGAASDFFHIVCLADVDTAATGTASLYVNGVLAAGPVTSTGTINDWDGGELAELGFGNNIPTSTGFAPEAFDGDIAFFNYYAGTLLTLETISEKFNAISGPGPAFAIREIIREADGSVTLNWDAVPNRTYAIDAYGFFPGWVELTDDVTPTTDQGTYNNTDAIGQPALMYRLRDPMLQGPP